MRRKGFTLIELVVVVAILGVIVAIATPQVLRNINKARRAADIQNARHIAYAFYLFEQESGQNLKVLIPDSNFHKIDSDVVTLSAPYSLKLSDYISGGLPRPIYRRSYCFYYKLDTVLKVYSGDGTDFYELFPNVDPNY
ncbi:type II secretion system protein [Anaerocellum danielii]|uniref:Type II secretion system protein n=1 Tax=Anaerocellum danielii TaxID=1387557 RepID=A0ABZ0U073_9FIRM|nr:type II secretion system protein [Caldicellulosiruptor danielii]WPX08023.1 type II secretion system protein [Caldicellulosiruptor danielii]